MDKVTDRQIFERVRDHLLRQNKQSVAVDSWDGSTRCRYRTNDGLACAVGCLIEDNYYSKDMEGNHAGTESVCKAVAQSLRLKGLKPSTVTLLRDLQRVHDEFTPDEWSDELAIVGENFSSEGQYHL
jgi:hypothetical protein